MLIGFQPTSGHWRRQARSGAPPKHRATTTPSLQRESSSSIQTFEQVNVRHAQPSCNSLSRCRLTRHSTGMCYLGLFSLASPSVVSFSLPSCFTTVIALTSRAESTTLVLGKLLLQTAQNHHNCSSIVTCSSALCLTLFHHLLRTSHCLASMGLRTLLWIIRLA